MPASRRMIISNRPYELCMRAAEGLPLPPTDYMNMLLLSVISRTQRDHKVTICHAQWMSNHAHMIIVARDAESCTKFYMEVQKKITDFLKRLLGKRRLRLWENRVTVCELQDIESVEKRIAYIYLNPVEANLVRKISESPFLSTWREFLKGKDLLDFRHTEQHPWIRLPAIRPLLRQIVSERMDWLLKKELKATATIKHELSISPNAWMRCFGVVTDEEAAAINERILERIERGVIRIETRRTAEKQSVLGIRALKLEPIMKSHEPKKCERKIMFIAATRKAALQFLSSFRVFCDACRECYFAWRKGDFAVAWPPGSFRPPIPPLANALW